MRAKFTLNRAGVAAILKSAETASMVNRATAGIASNVKASVPAGVSVETRSGVTDRATGQVVVADGRALGWQAKDGLFTRATAAAGVEVRDK